MNGTYISVRDDNNFAFTHDVETVVLMSKVK